MKRQDAWNILDELNRVVAEQGESSTQAQGLVKRLKSAGYGVRAVCNRQGRLMCFRPDFSASVNHVKGGER